MSMALGVDIALGVLALAFALGIIRAVIGPTVADRAVAADVCLYTVVAAVALIALRSATPAYVDVVVVATLLGFLATVALAALITRWGS